MPHDFLYTGVVNQAVTWGFECGFHAKDTWQHICFRLSLVSEFKNPIFSSRNLLYLFHSLIWPGVEPLGPLEVIKRLVENVGRVLSCLWFGSRIEFTIVTRDIRRNPWRGNLGANFRIIGRGQEARYSNSPPLGYLQFIHITGAIMPAIGILLMVTSTPETVLFHHFHVPSRFVTFNFYFPAPAFLTIFPFHSEGFFWFWGILLLVSQ